MWRLKREDVPGVPDAVRVSVEPIDAPVAVSPEALAAAETGSHAITDAQLIARLRQHISSQEEVIARLRAELDERPSERPFHGCPGCAGLRKTVAELQAAGREDSATIARLTLASPAGRAQTLGAPLRPMPDGGT